MCSTTIPQTACGTLCSRCLATVVAAAVRSPSLLVRPAMLALAVGVSVVVVAVHVRQRQEQLQRPLPPLRLALLLLLRLGHVQSGTSGSWLADTGSHLQLLRPLPTLGRRRSLMRACTGVRRSRAPFTRCWRRATP